VLVVLPYLFVLLLSAAPIIDVVYVLSCLLLLLYAAEFKAGFHPQKVHEQPEG
jgi:hypothetical protein